MRNKVLVFFSGQSLCFVVLCHDALCPLSDCSEGLLEFGTGSACILGALLCPAVSCTRLSLHVRIQDNAHFLIFILINIYFTMSCNFITLFWPLKAINILIYRFIFLNLTFFIKYLLGFKHLTTHLVWSFFLID